MAKTHPFQTLFETFGRVPTAHAEAVNRDAYEKLSDILAAPTVHPGGCILLRAPRAGHGKTHLLSRLYVEFEATHAFIQIRPSCGYHIDAPTVMEDVLRYLAASESGMRPETRMDLMTRRLLAMALLPLVESGEVPSQDREWAVGQLRHEPLETFDFKSPSAVTAHWMVDHFELLQGRLANELARECALPLREVEFWISQLFAYVAGSGDLPGRQMALENAVLSENHGEATQMARLEALLALMTLTTRVVLIADDLEGLSVDNDSGLRLATFIVAIRQSVQRLDILLSLNADVWEGMFLNCLSDGMADRLAERLVELDALSEPQMVDLIESRAPGQGEEIMARIDLARSGRHPRGLIREAGQVWLQIAKAKPVPPHHAVWPPVDAVSPDEVWEDNTDDIGGSNASDHPAIRRTPLPPPVPSEGEEYEMDPADVARADQLMRQFRERSGQES